ncbi:macrolide ABC transporter permease/ATP-binding protein MacB (plasmid) [Azospirillum humicireducens]|uniref:Macrolide ABC transporter permease/ATP-binding protein MacB n=1 Tax=Azospirillum humicireducens TaxID=1226968 RepID=A0A2R4VRT5_9PROT|nr:MacB family efflux pump subunit [Azospirillum humicireducens]AWB07150.1 macrolide ABC transporter permease/ATP-binding protein MacB [Azospirillum humicireducens]
MEDRRRPPAQNRVPAVSRPLLVLEDIRKTYGGDGGVAVEVLRGVSLSIEAGEFVAIVGSSGSGKSTLMNIIGGLDRPTSGRYRIGGQDVTALEGDDRAALRRDGFGFVFQQYHLIPGTTAQENVELPGRYAGRSAAERESRAAELLGRLGLAERLHHRPNQLSGGQQQRVSIARALMNDAPVILADEPTGALDSASGAEVMTLLRELSDAGRTVILITHDHKIAEAAGRVVEMRDGRIVADSGHSIQPPAHAPPAPPTRGAGGASLWMDAAEALSAALRSLAANGFRTALTLLGIVIGVASVIALLAIGEGAKQAVMARVGALGVNLVFVLAGSGDPRLPATPLTEADGEAILQLPNVESVMPFLAMPVMVRHGNIDLRTEGLATSASLPLTHRWPVAQGTFFTGADERAGAAVAVLGHSVAERLFPRGETPLGKHVLVNNIPFLVTGVMAQKGDLTGNQSTDDWVFVPLSTGVQRLIGKPDLEMILVSVHDVGRIGQTREAIHALLSKRHGQEDFQIHDVTARIQAAEETQDTMTLLLGCAAVITLLVGGIGVMNIMLVSVTERTREIGIRMAVGARAADIERQFLMEAALVAGLGGLAGVALGLAGGAVVGVLAMPVVFTATAIAGAVTSAVVTGIVFGLIPARRAARLDPVTALASD